MENPDMKPSKFTPRLMIVTASANEKEVL
jgi:hypothetical protein